MDITVTPFLNFHEVQSASSVLYALFACTLIVVSFHRLRGVTKVSTWIMGLGYLLASASTAFHNIFPIHDGNPALGFALNLVAFMTVAYLMFIALLYLMRQGHIARREWLAVPICWLACIGLSGAAYHFGNCRLLLIADYIVSALCIIEIAYLYNKLHATVAKLKASLSEFFDPSIHQMLSWILVSERIFLVFSLIMPVFMFFRSPWLVLFEYAMIGAMSYLCVAFSLYCVSNDAVLAAQAETIEEETQQRSGAEDAKEPALTKEQQDVVALRLQRWLDEKGFLQRGISIKDVSETTGVGMTLLRLWLSVSGRGTFSQWLSHLRIDHAKTLLADEHHWTIDVIAERCAFSNRQGFIRAFKKETGCNPSEWEP